MAVCTLAPATRSKAKAIVNILPIPVGVLDCRDQMPVDRSDSEWEDCRLNFYSADPSCGRCAPQNRDCPEFHT